MNATRLPARLGPLALALPLVLAALLLGTVLPAGAAAGPLPEGEGTVKISPDPISLPTTTAGAQSNAVPVSIAYEGEGEVSISGVSVEGAEGGEFALSSANCGNLAGGQTCEAWVAFKPGSAGLKQAQLVVRFGSRPSVFATLEGLAVEPSLSFSPSSHDFGLWRVNRETAYENFTVENDGAAAVMVNYDDVAGPGHDAYWINGQDCSGRTLQPHQTCWVQVAFNPHQRIGYEAALRVSAGSATFEAQLLGEGGGAQVEAPENPVDLGTATVGGSGTVRAITLHNSGDMPETFFIGVLAGGDAASFELLDENCTLVSLGPGESCTAHVRFAPDSAGPKVARLAFFGDGEGGSLVQVEGEGVAPAATLLPAGFDFGAVPAGERSAAHEFVVRNDGTTALALDRVSLAGADVDQFAISGDECSDLELAPGAACAVRVRFAPDGAGARSATLRVSGPSLTLTAALTGTAAGAAALPAASEPAPPAARHRKRLVHGETLDARRARFLHRRGKRAGKHRAVGAAWAGRRAR